MSNHKPTLLFAILTLASVLFTYGAQANERPNMVFILADDMSFDSVSANNEKMGPLETPHLDKLISQGMNFTDAHSASAVCTPTRYGLVTGRYCWRTRLKNSVLWDWGAPLIEEERLTVPEMLKQQGYSTGMVGKWHLGLTWFDEDGQVANADLRISDASWKKGEAGERPKAVAARIDFTKAVRGGPIDHGFDYYFGVDVPNFPPYLWIENDKLQGIPSIPKPDEIYGTTGPMLPGWKLEEILPGLAKRGGEWISEQSTKNQPFFLYLSLTSPHTPIAPSKEFQGKSGISAYADFIIETDWVVGHIMDALDQAGVANNTLVIFSTDNGTSGVADFKKLESHGVNVRHHFKGHKGQIHEGGHRVPFVARWPDKIKPGSVCHQTICLNDFMATTADILNIELPDDAGEDSTSILPLLVGEKTSLPNRPLVVNHDYGGSFAIRKGKWKLVHHSQLFDLQTDPKESKNVDRQFPEIVLELSTTLKKYKESGRSRPASNAK